MTKTAINHDEKKVMNVYKISIQDDIARIDALVAASTKIEACALLWGAYNDYVSDIKGCVYFEHFCDICTCKQEFYTVNIIAPLILMYNRNEG